MDEDEIAKVVKHLHDKEKLSSKTPGAKKVDLRRKGTAQPYAAPAGPSQPVVPEVKGTSSACNGGKSSALEGRIHSQRPQDSSATEST